MKKLNFFTAKPLKVLLFCLSLCGHLVNSYAADSSTTFTAEQISDKALAYIRDLLPQPEQGELSFSVTPLDPRIKIKPCASPLQLTIPGNATLSRHSTVLVSCDDPNGWNLYVQIKMSHNVPVVVSIGDLAPGTLISEANITTILRDTAQVRGRTLQQQELLFGAKTSRYISAGQPITLEQVCMVCKGDYVTIMAKIKGLEIKTSGIAQQNGSLGDNIVILNSRTSKRLEARVVAVNEVEINL